MRQRYLHLLLALLPLLVACASTNTPRPIPLAPGEPGDTPISAKVTCHACDKPFPIRVMRGAVENAQDVLVPPDEPDEDGLRTAVQCPYCRAPVRVHVQVREEPAPEE